MPLTGLPVAGTGRRSAALAAWATAWLQRRAPADRAIAAVTGHDEPHLIEPDGDLASLLADLRSAGAAGLRLVLPVPGDPRGLPGPGPLTAAALDAGEAVVAQGAGVGYVPVATSHGSLAEGFTTVVRWQSFPCAPGVSEPPGTLRQTEHDLTIALRDAASTLARLDVASLSPRAAERLAAMRAGARRPLVQLPPSHPAVAQHLLQQAERLAVVLEIASDDDGAAVDIGSARERRRVLREFAGVVRRARVVAVNAPLDEA
jgi:hypothetical protein